MRKLTIGDEAIFDTQMIHPATLAKAICTGYPSDDDFADMATVFHGPRGAPAVNRENFNSEILRVYTPEFEFDFDHAYELYQDLQKVIHDNRYIFEPYIRPTLDVKVMSRALLNLTRLEEICISSTDSRALHKSSWGARGMCPCYYEDPGVADDRSDRYHQIHWGSHNRQTTPRPSTEGRL